MNHSVSRRGVDELDEPDVMRSDHAGSAPSMLDHALTRRGFVAACGQTVAGIVVVSCGGGGEAPLAPPEVGHVAGRVVDVAGTPQAGFGTIILMYPDGRHVGITATPDARGQFAFRALAAGDYQIRFQAAGQAIIPEPYQHPLKFTVTEGRTTEVTVHVQRGTFPQTQVEIYCGDDFYQLQPAGAENGETVVKVGTIVCWYNVGLKIHTVTGGPWNDSGDLQKTQSYIWVADAPGLYLYRCKYNQPGMQASLRVMA